MNETTLDELWEKEQEQSSLKTKHHILKNWLENNFVSGKYFSIEEIIENVRYADGTPLFKLNTNPKIHDKCIKLSKMVKDLNWAKKTSLPVIEPNVMNSDFEYIYVYTNEKENGKHIRIGQDFRGNVSNVIIEDRNMNNEYASIHSALMPIKIADKIITQFTNENDLVLDPFGGLGTTMMSCIKNNRRCYSIELQPLYCEKTIERYLDFVVGKPSIKIIRNGKEISCDEILELCQKKQMSIFE